MKKLLADPWWIISLAFLVAAVSNGVIQYIAEEGGYYSEPPWPFDSMISLVIVALMYLIWRAVIRGLTFCWLLAFNPNAIDRVLGPVDR
jgi:hypothetical protein